MTKNNQGEYEAIQKLIEVTNKLKERERTERLIRATS